MLKCSLVGKDKDSHLEVKAKNHSKLVELLIGALAGDVLMFIVRVELDMLAGRKYRSSIKCGGAPLFVLAQIKNLCGDIRCWMIGTYGDSALQGYFVAVAPVELTFGPIEVCTIAVGK